MSLEVSGDDLSKLDNEAGGHRIQRVSPTEKRGRVHTSTVTVAVMASEVAQSVVTPSHSVKIHADGDGISHQSAPVNPAQDGGVSPSVRFEVTAHGDGSSSQRGIYQTLGIGATVGVHSLLLLYGDGDRFSTLFPH